MKNNPYKVLTIILLAVLLTFPIKAGLESLFSGSKLSTIVTQPSSNESNTPLTSSVDQKYINLQKYVKEEKWSEANEETKKLILTIAGKESKGSLDDEDLITFPCNDIAVISAIWEKNQSKITDWFDIIANRTAWLAHPGIDCRTGQRDPTKMRCSFFNRNFAPFQPC